MSLPSIRGAFRRTGQDGGLPRPWVAAIELFPVVAVLAFALLLQVPRTRPRARWLLLENRPVELATFVFLLAGGILALRLALAARRHGEPPLVWGFYLVFSVGMLVTGMEEIAWGQLLLGFEPPAFLDRLNVKGETTIHNIRGLDGRTEVLRVLFGVGGLVGLVLARRARWRDVAPSPLLGSWFVVIASLALIDLWDDLARPADQILDLIFRLNELNEMLVGLAGLLYVWLNSRRLRRRWARADGVATD